MQLLVNRLPDVFGKLSHRRFHFYRQFCVFRRQLYPNVYILDIIRMTVKGDGISTPTR